MIQETITDSTSLSRITNIITPIKLYQYTYLPYHLKELINLKKYLASKFW